MLADRRRRILLSLALFGAGAAAAAGCGGDDNTTTVTETAGGDTTTTDTSSGTSSGASSGGNPLSEISPPSGSKQLASKSQHNTYYERYKTDDSPQKVQSTYKSELESAGWTIKNSGGSSGGWGPYGGANYGLTAKRGDDYFDVQAGGEKNDDTYFEVCATTGNGTVSDCNKLSNKTGSGGSAGGDDNNKSNSGGS